MTKEPLLAACKPWLAIETGSAETDEAAREAVRADVRALLTSGEAAAANARAAFDAAIAAAGAAANEPEARAAFAKFTEGDDPTPIPDPPRVPRVAVPVGTIQAGYPSYRLALHRQSGAVLVNGSVGLLSGEGGIGKSALALSIGLGVAMLPDDRRGEVADGLFHGYGGPVLITTFEDEPGETAGRAKALARILDANKKPEEVSDKRKDSLAGDTLNNRLHLLDLAEAPLFGPTDRGDGFAGLYGARPGPLDGWEDLWREARRVEARLIIIDPATAAFVSESNSVAGVREFMSAVAGQARRIGAAVLIVSHSNKGARGQESPDPFDPGQVSGSTGWTDAARGVLTFSWFMRATAPPGEEGKEDDDGERIRLLAVSKSNYGPARLSIVADPIHNKPTLPELGEGRIVGFRADDTDGWKTELPRKPKPVQKNNPGRRDARTQQRPRGGSSHEEPSHGR